MGKKQEKSPIEGVKMNEPYYSMQVHSHRLLFISVWEGEEFETIILTHHKTRQNQKPRKNFKLKVLK